MNNISQPALNSLRRSFKKGDRVRLLHMEDPYAVIPVGTQGTVNCVDDIGTIHVHWDNGSSLGVVYGEDRCAKM